MWAALSRRMASRPRKVTEIEASRRSDRSTDSITRRTSTGESGRRRPLTRTSLTLGRLEFRGYAAARPRVADSLVVGTRHDAGELPLDSIEITKGQWGIVQLPRSDLLLDQMLDGAAHRIRGWIAQHPHRRLRRVGQHRHRRLSRLGARTGVAEISGIYSAIGVVTPCPAQKVGNVCSPMVLWDKGFHHFGQSSSLGQRYAISDVALNDPGRLLGAHEVMRIGCAALVFHEMTRVGQLSDVVVIATHAGKQAVGPDDVAGRLTEAGHGEAVGPGAGRLHGQTAEQGPAQIGELEQGQIGGDPSG